MDYLSSNSIQVIREELNKKYSKKVVKKGVLPLISGLNIGKISVSDKIQKITNSYFFEIWPLTFAVKMGKMAMMAKGKNIFFYDFVIDMGCQNR